MKTRRGFLAGAAAAAANLACPITLFAQAPKRIGVLANRGGSFNRGNWAGTAFVAAMKELGYVEGRDYIFDDRQWQRQEEIPDLVRDLVRLEVAVIIAAAPPSIVAAKSVTDSVPIVMAFSAEPVATGLVRSLGRPGGNLTGLTWDHGFEATTKAVEILKETLPKIRRVAVMWDATDSVHPIYAKYFDKAMSQLSLKSVSLGVQTADDFEPAFAQFRRQKANALIVLPSAQLTNPHRVAIMALATRDRIPTLASIAIVQLSYPGALLHYGPNLESTPRRAARYVHQIFKGAKAGELPIEQPDKYDLFVDLKVAQSLGIKVPPSILIRADRVIE